MRQKIIEISPIEDVNISYRCEMSEQLRKHLGLSQHINSLKITCGRHTVTCPIVFIKKESLSLSVSKQVLDNLHLPHHLTIRGKMKEEHHLQLGPVIGLLTEIYKKDNKVCFGSIHDFCKELSFYSKENGAFFYIFSLQSYDQNQPRGYYLLDDEWVEATVPYPDVVHNRIHSRKTEQSKKFLNVTSEFIKNKVPYFNNRYLNKWEVHQILFASDHLIPYLPESRLLESKSVLQNMLDDKKDIFIKPINGSQGRRIFRVIKHKDQTYSLDLTSFTREINRNYDNFNSMFTALYPQLKREGFLLQETINIKKYLNRTVDFRFLCHKKDYQQWKVTSAIARVSSESQFVANLAKGGKVRHIRELLNELYGSNESLHLRKLMAELSLEIVNSLCLYAGGNFGEFGIDLALDEEGYPWIIEVNTKPSKSENISNTKQTRPSARAIINYCLFLSPFSE